MRNILFILLICLLQSCMKGESVDFVVFNANIHSLDEGGHIHQAMAIRDGKIIELGPDRQILNKYRYDQSIDAAGKDIYPGFIDAHGHLFSYAELKLGANLLGSKSEEEMLNRVHEYQEKANRKIIIGSGWDQSLWGNSVLPDNTRLNEEFPNIPVLLYRIDGHSALINQKFIDNDYAPFVQDLFPESARNKLSSFRNYNEDQMETIESLWTTMTSIEI